MNEVRQNKEEEQKIAEAKFGISKPIKIIYAITFIILLIFVIAVIMLFVHVEIDSFNLFSDYGYAKEDDLSRYVLKGVATGLVFGIPCYIIMLGMLVGYFSLKTRLKKCKCIITNKTIQGVNAGVFGAKYYSYKLDQIENVEIQTSFGIKSLALQFSQGQINSSSETRYGEGQKRLSGTNVFLISNLINEQELYKELTELLLNVKTDKDVAAEIEVKKIEAEEKKAEALYKMAEGLVDKKETINEDNDYINQIERLYKLKEQGIISEEEFLEKKSKLLKKIENI